MKVNNNMKYIKNLLTLLNQLKIYHWQTTSFAQHQAFGSSYDALDDLIDKFVEVYMGRYSRIFSKEGGNFSVNLFDYDALEPSTFLKNVRNYLEDLEVPTPGKDTDLLNLRDEMLAEVDKLTYLLTLE